MSYVKPEEVLSPRNSVGGIVEVIHDPGEGGMSVARIIWDGDEVIATRWNGTDDRPLGTPVARGHATWLVIDEYAAAAMEEAARKAAQSSPNSLVAKYREMAADEDREHAAEEWSEGLIGDGNTEG
ncbi:MAG TPA: hypothetical protein VL240_14730 [Candidatus Binatia bacterium]|nr:hypothetical protein [Candidatus Binatia bacterium]